MDGKKIAASTGYDSDQDNDLDKGESGRSAVRFLFHGRFQEQVNHKSGRKARGIRGKAKG